MIPRYAELLELEPSARLQLVQDIWNSLLSAPENIPIPDWHAEELDRREGEELSNPDPGISWEDAKQAIFNRHG